MASAWGTAWGSAWGDSWGEVGGGEEPPAPPPAAETQERSHGSRKRYRIIEDPERLEVELHKQEKVVEKDKKKLRILFKQQASAEGFLYQQIDQKIEKLEAKIDERMAKIAEIIAAMPEIEDDDDEELLFS